MATASAATSRGGYTLLLSAVEESVDTAARTATLLLVLSLKANGTYFQQYELDYSLTLDGAFAAGETGKMRSMASSTDEIELLRCRRTISCAGKSRVAVAGALSGPSAGSYTPGEGAVALTLSLSAPSGAQLTGLEMESPGAGVAARFSPLAGESYDLILRVGNESFAQRAGVVSGERIFLTPAEILAFERLCPGATTAVTAVLITRRGTAELGRDEREVSSVAAGTVRCAGAAGFSRGRIFVRSGGRWLPGAACVFSGVWRSGR